MKVPAVKWKRYQSERPDEGQLRRWFDPEFGGRHTRIGILLGSVSGRLAVRDFDIGEKYDEWAEKYPEYARVLPTVKTRRGAHVYHIVPTDSSVTKTLKFADGELRYEKSFVVVPPSLHSDNVHYEWMISLSTTALREIDPVEIGMIGELARSKKGGKRKAAERIPEGQRNDTLASMAGSMRRRGATEEAILAELLEVNRNRCDPPLPVDEVGAIARSISQYPPQAGEIVRLTELGNARRLVRRHGQDLRFVGLARKWYAWDGKRWCPDETGESYRRMKETVRSIYDEATRCEDSEMRERIAKWAIRSESEKIIKAGLSLAQSEPGLAVMPSVFDTDHWSLSCLNGTIDLRTGQLRSHDRADMITRLVPVDYRSGAPCPLWHKFLDRVMNGNQALQEYLKRIVGYALTGDTREQVIFILYGTGQNGKSKFLEVLRLMLGDYSLNTPAKTLVVRSPSDATNDQARLNGARLVTATEWEEGQRMAEGFVKQVTGGDTVTARFHYKEFVDFVPTFKLFLGTNHKPQIRGGDLAMRRRVRLIPFTVTIPEEERDKNIVEKLRTELPGILNWAVEGCLGWQREGLGEPPVVTEATAAYCEEMDVMARFVAERCVEEVGKSATAASLFKSYLEWCTLNGEKPMTQTAFGMRLGERGFVKKKIKGIVEWFGVGLLTGENGPEGSRAGDS